MPPQVEGRAAPPRAPQSAKFLYRSKASERGEFFRRKKRGKPQVGFPLLLSFESAKSLATFFFDAKGAKKKVIKRRKELLRNSRGLRPPTPIKVFRALRSARRGYAPLHLRRHRAASVFSLSDNKIF